MNWNKWHSCTQGYGEIQIKVGGLTVSNKVSPLLEEMRMEYTIIHLHEIVFSLILYVNIYSEREFCAAFFEVTETRKR